MEERNRLVLEVDSSGVTAATGELNNLPAAAARAERGALNLRSEFRTLAIQAAAFTAAAGAVIGGTY